MKEKIIKQRVFYEIRIEYGDSVITFNQKSGVGEEQDEIFMTKKYLPELIKVLQQIEKEGK